MRIATWNMQGGVNTMYINQVVQATQANVLCLQECGALAEHLHGIVPIIGLNGAIIGYTGNFVVGQGFFMECVYWENIWIQGSLAVLSNISPLYYGILDAAPVLGFVPPNVRNLPWMTVQNPNTGINITVFSIHAPPVFAPTTIANVCNWNNAQITQIADVTPGYWACVGDFNADPTIAGYIPPPVGNVVRSNRATQQGEGILDYAVTNALAFTYVPPTQVVSASDHFPQVFQW
ncbi:endonuclease/exonuclease/phosphatase family protein [[Phormidium] sp. ETS-05]|uniref:endonuclease/exonuclease/phosphatase family protein n=1 Tax=[Phormidium] sp. ETS-05 TaxID=222819 RepID=UPI0018EF25FE|nr:endonuclease/exonuclease/phosphatase family protein [[Phormidium] sp. ETS-05]